MAEAVEIYCVGFNMLLNAALCCGCDTERHMNLHRLSVLTAADVGVMPRLLLRRLDDAL